VKEALQLSSCGSVVGRNGLEKGGRKGPPDPGGSAVAKRWTKGAEKRREALTRYPFVNGGKRGKMIPEISGDEWNSPNENLRGRVQG